MSKEIVKRNRRPSSWRPWSVTNGLVVTYYMVPCFGHVYGVYDGKYIGDFGSVGSVGPIIGEHFLTKFGEQIHPWNASSPLAKKEYDKKYKCWGRRVMKSQLAQGDNR